MNGVESRAERAIFPHWIPAIPPALYAWQGHEWLSALFVLVVVTVAFVALGRAAATSHWSAKALTRARWALFFVAMIAVGVSAMDACTGPYGTNCHRIFY